MSSVPWVTTSPELVEKIVAVMLSRENERAHRIRASKGDGGLDIVVPTGPKLPGPVTDYQIKYFATNLSGNQKAQIEHSLLSARDTHLDPASGFTIDLWLLTLPLDQTREQSEWLASLATTHEIPFPVEWRGLNFLDGLAAKYGDVVDYYLSDGRVRLESSIKDLRGLVGLPDGSDPGHLLLPADVYKPLSNLFLALNRDDPHYRYEYELTAVPPPPVFRPGLVASASRTEGGVCITVHIIARYELATVDVPVPISIQIDPSTMDETTKGSLGQLSQVRIPGRAEQRRHQPRGDWPSGRAGLGGPHCWRSDRGGNLTDDARRQRPMVHPAARAGLGGADRRSPHSRRPPHVRARWRDARHRAGRLWPRPRADTYRRRPSQCDYHLLLYACRPN